MVHLKLVVEQRRDGENERHAFKTQTWAIDL